MIHFLAARLRERETLCTCCLWGLGVVKKNSKRGLTVCANIAFHSHHFCVHFLLKLILVRFICIFSGTPKFVRFCWSFEVHLIQSQYIFISYETRIVISKLGQIEIDRWNQCLCVHLMKRNLAESFKNCWTLVWIRVLNSNPSDFRWQRAKIGNVCWHTLTAAVDLSAHSWHNDTQTISTMSMPIHQFANISYKLVITILWRERGGTLTQPVPNTYSISRYFTLPQPFEL